MANTSMLMKISSPADVIWSALLNDKEKLDKFLALNIERLREASGYARRWFEERGVEVAYSNS